jgi:hypothetical protein
MTKRFFVNTPQSGIRFGKNLRTSGATIEPGLVVKLDSSGSTASLCESDEAPLGIAYGERHEVYTPTTRVFADAEKLVVVTGNYLALISADFFSSGSLPTTSPTTLYTADDGKIGTSSSSTTKIGEYLRTEAVMQPVGGTGTSQNLAFCRFNFQP